MKKKVKYEEIPEVEIIDGEEVFNLGASEADADPIRYRRLLKEGKLEEAKKMLEGKMYYAKREDGTYY